MRRRANLILAPLAVEAERAGDVHVEGVEEEGAVLAALELGRAGLREH